MRWPGLLSNLYVSLHPMSRLRSWLTSLGFGAHRVQLEREMSDEMQTHIDMETAYLESQGLPPAEARRRAVVSFGGEERFKEEVRDTMALRWVNDFAADVKFALRSLRRTPVFTAVAILALTFGIGAATTVFGLVDSTAFRKLPIPEPDRLVALFRSTGDATLLGSSYRTSQTLRDSTRSFSDMAVFTEGTVALAGTARPTAAWAMHTSDNYFALLGLRAEIGRFYGNGDLHKPLVVLSHAFWQDVLRGDRSIVGRTIGVNGGRFTVIGVAPAHFTGTRLFTYAPALWIPVGMHEQTLPGNPNLLAENGPRRFNILARLRDEVSTAHAQAELDSVAERISGTDPQAAAQRFTLLANASPINPWLAPHERIELFGTLMLAAVSLVLIIACVNVASLLLARMSTRGTEIRVRLALGASSGRLLRQFFAEGLVLALLGIVGAIAIALIAIPAAINLTPPLDFTTSTTPIIDARLLIFALVAGLLSTLVFGLAQFAYTLSSGSSLQARTRTTGRTTRARNALLVAQVALSVFVLAAAGMFARALRSAHAIDVGFEARNAIAFTLDARLLPDYDSQRADAFYRTLVSRLAAVDGVRSVTRAAFVPLAGDNISLRVDGVASDAFTVDENYFATMGIPIVAGSSFSAADSNRIEPIVVNEILAKRLAYSGSIIGRSVRLGGADGPLAEVVGIVRASASRQLSDAPRPLVWLSVYRNPAPRATVIVRTDRPPAAMLAAVRATVHSVDSRLPFIRSGTLEDQVAVAYSAVRTAALIGAAFGALAAILAATGIFGVVSYTVSQRTREIGVRAALGARPAHILALVTGGALRLAAVGVVIGLAMTLVLPAGISKTLYGVSPHDPIVLAISAIAFLCVAVLASLIPARRALRLDPARALRLD